MPRIIGIRHRVKRTAEGESRPTLIAIKTGDKTTLLELEDEQAELDFVFGKFPVATRPATEGENLSVFPPHHVTERKKKGLDEMETRVPAEYEGLNAGDSVVMILGGSGDRLAFALSRQGEKIGAKVFRIPGFQLAARRGETDKKEDHSTLIRVFHSEPRLFYEFGPADRDNIAVSELQRTRRDTQVDRIACEQRLRQRLIGQVFLSEEGGYPEGTFADELDKLKANDVIFKTLMTEEKRREAELKTAVHRLPIWREFLLGVEGCGEVLAAGIIAPIVDIRMFRTDAKLKAFCGVHLEARLRCTDCGFSSDVEGLTIVTDMMICPKCRGSNLERFERFARKRSGSTANWNPRARQALYLLGGQFVYRADSEWGLKLREYKAKFRAKHPVVECSACGLPWEQCQKKNSGEVVLEPSPQEYRESATHREGAMQTKGKKHVRRYTDGHIHKMALWRTLTKFVERLHREWKRIDAAEKSKESAAA